MLELIIIIVLFILTALVVDYTVGLGTVVELIVEFAAFVRPSAVRKEVDAEVSHRLHSHNNDAVWNSAWALRQEYEGVLPSSIWDTAWDQLMDIRHDHNMNKLSFKAAVKKIDRIKAELIRAQKLLG
jgi:hypothetical protein